MLLLGNIGQQMDLDDHESDIATLRLRLERSTARLTRTSAELKQLQAENDELKLYLATVFRILVAKNIVTHRELTELVSAIDREDGEEDNAFRGDVIPPRQT
jgi:hypothetical protein